MEPKPHESHEPMDGLPLIILPVYINWLAGSWLMASVFMERIRQRSSAIFAVHGRVSLNQVPASPCCVNLKTEGATGKLACPAVIPVRRSPWAAR